MSGFIQIKTAYSDHLLNDAFPTELHILTGETAYKSDNINYTLFVIEGNVTIKNSNSSFTLSEGMYATCSEPFEANALGKVLIIAQKNYTGLFSIGGPIEQKGRLRYIDGCSDTLLISPDVLGSPCLNLLHIPKNTNQTSHTHPSYRVGVIVSGRGLCKTPTETIDLYPGLIFIIEKDAFHSFFTTDEELRVVAYHPDSDFGPTNENHPMINKTIIHEVS